MNNTQEYLQQSFDNLQKAGMLQKADKAEELIKRIVNIVLHQEKKLDCLRDEIKSLKDIHNESLSKKKLEAN